MYDDDWIEPTAINKMSLCYGCIYLANCTNRDYADVVCPLEEDEEENRER